MHEQFSKFKALLQTVKKNYKITKNSDMLIG